MSEIDKAKLGKPFPPEAIKTREGGRGAKLRYVEGHSVIHRLNEATGNQWNFAVLNVSERERVVRTREGERTVEEIRALVELEIPGLGKRQHVGVQTISAGGGEDLYKGAITDALKKAATLFGVGLELYGPDYEDAETAPAPKSANGSGTKPPSGSTGPANASRSRSGNPHPAGSQAAADWDAVSQAMASAATNGAVPMPNAQPPTWCNHCVEHSREEKEAKDGTGRYFWVCRNNPKHREEVR